MEQLLMFITGTNQIPPVGFENKISVKFKHDCDAVSSNTKCKCRPTTSTCALQLIIPIHIDSSEECIELFIDAIKNGQGFGKV